MMGINKAEARAFGETRAASDWADSWCPLPGEAAISDALLPGENPTVGFTEDMELWIGVYSALLDYKRFIIDEATARAGELRTDIARAEIETADLSVFRADADRFKRRLSFWSARLDTVRATEPAAG